MTDAPGIVAPETRDLGELAASLTQWLSKRLPGSRDIAISNLSYPLGAGMSHETILFDAAWREGEAQRQQGMVVRIKPTRKCVYLDDMFEAQYELMRLMHAGGAVRIAKPLWFEKDATLLGAPFFVMEKVKGQVAVSYPPYTKQGWLFDATPEQRRIVWHDSVSQLAAIQKTPASAAPFLALPGGPDGFDQEVDRWRRFMNWVDPQKELSLLRKAFDQLLAIKPQIAPMALSGATRASAT